MLTTLASSLREFKKNAILTPIYVSLEVVVDTLIPFMMKFLLDCFDQQTGNIDVKSAVIYGVIIVGLSLVALLFGALSGAQCAVASAGLARNLRHDMFSNIQSFSFKNLDKFSNSSLITRLTTDVVFVQQAFMMIIRTAIRAPLVLVFAIVMSVVIGGAISLIYVFVIPVMVFLLILIFLKASKYFKKVFKKYDVLNRVVEENVSGMRVVKSNVREDTEIEKFTSASNDIYKLFSKAQGIIVYSGPVMQISMYVCITLICYFGARAVVGDANMDVSNISVLTTYAMQVLMSLMMLSFIFVQVVIAKASAERIYEVLVERSDITDKENCVTAVKDGSITFENVSFKYSDTAEGNSLIDVDLQIKSGETIGILGSTGSSKTTLVQLIPRLYDVSQGRLLVGGVDVRDYSVTSLRSAVSMVLQKNVLFSGTIRENLLWGNPDASDEQIALALKISASDEFVDRLGGLETKIEQGGANLSGGQRQRLCIARAIIGNPKILILDDSTSAVDMGTDARIRKWFAEFMPDTTKIIIAQRVASVSGADRIIVMEGGRINGVGTHEQLLKDNEIYREIYQSQTRQGGDFDAKNE
ncbi:MAG: ABC transporter ATP-binding protein [Clostridia bacterium]|nr:ABC transporter ATP-binding protein [Clostridia bacterium]